MASKRAPRALPKSQASLRATLGWVARRAKQEGKDPERAKNGYLGFLTRLVLDDARGRGVGPRPPGASKPRAVRGGAILYAAPRESDGTISPQPALGEGSVIDDIFKRVGAKVSKQNKGRAFSKAAGLQKVRGVFRQERGEGTGKFRRVERTITIHISPNASPRDREIAIARAVSDMARQLIESNTRRKLLLESAASRATKGDRRNVRRPKRKPWSKRKPKGDRKATRIN